jgi:hypothetical protein
MQMKNNIRFFKGTVMLEGPFWHFNRFGLPPKKHMLAFLGHIYFLFRTLCVLYLKVTNVFAR